MAAYIPDYTQWMQSVQGWPSEFTGAIALFAGASNVVVGSNPPFTVADLLTLYPNFFGPPTSINGTTDGATAALLGVSGAAGVSTAALALGQFLYGPGLQPGTGIMGVTASTLDRTGDTTAGIEYVTSLSSAAGLYAGQPIAGPGIPADTTIAVPGNTSLQLSQDATATADGVALEIQAVTLQLSAVPLAAGTGVFLAFTQPTVPLAVLNAFIAMASGSLQSQRYDGSWRYAMGLYVAHFVTLWAQAQGTPANSAAMLALAGASRGILTSKSADGLSMSFQTLGGFEDWGAWALTSYGQQLITFARAIGSGSMLLW